ncbi:MAG: CvpA family protein [Ruminococcaceae bacterium]|nr:CvpA family protein [Oscillospiraceae bacterium]
MAYILDVAVILIVVLCVWRGFRHGLVRTAVMLVGFMLAAFVAGQAATPLAQGIYNAAIAPRVEAVVTERLQELGDTEITVGLETLFGEGTMLIPYFESMGWDTAVTVSPSDRSEQAFQQAIRPAVAKVLQPAVVYLLEAVISFLLFVLLLVAVSLLSRLLDAVFKLPLLKQLNRFGGLAAGFLTGVFWALVFTAVLQFAIGCGWLGTAITSETVEETRLVSKLVNWNWMF